MQPLCAYTAEQLAELTGAGLTTARRWKRGGPIPEPARRLLHILTERELAPLAPRWRGWRLTHEGLLLSPEQWEFTPGDITVLPILRQRLAELQRRAEPMPDPSTFPGAQCDWISGRWRLPE